MDLNYLLSTNIEYDIFDFMGVRRNIRNSIEAYYDLFNFTFDDTYLDLSKYFSKNINTQMSDVLLNDIRYSKYLEKKSFNISYKACIAKSNGLDEKRFDSLKEISIDSNSVVHPDIFTTGSSIQEKVDILKKLLNTDCLLLADSFELLEKFYAKKFSISYFFNPYKELETLQTCLFNCGNYITFSYN